MTNDSKTCRACGASFKRSPCDTTVNCPDCRKGTRRSATRPSSSRSIQPIKAVEAHVIPQDIFGEGDTTPVIAQAFHPDRGWKTYPFRKRISVSWAQKMRGEGYTTVGLECFPGRVADFSLNELVREYGMFEWAKHAAEMRGARIAA